MSYGQILGSDLSPDNWHPAFKRAARWTADGKTWKPFYIEKNGSFQLHPELHMTSGYGGRFHPFFREWRHHTGKDIVRREGGPLGLAFKGSGSFDTVASNADPRLHGFGNVGLVTLDEAPGQIFTAAHLERVPGKTPPKTGLSPTMWMGSTGVSTGRHFHNAVYQTQGKDTRLLRGVRFGVGPNGNLVAVNPASPRSSNTSGSTAAPAPNSPSSSPAPTNPVETGASPYVVNVNNFIGGNTKKKEKEDEEEGDWFSPSKIAQALLSQTMQNVFSMDLPDYYA